MKTIIYKFADGTSNIVEVSDEIYAVHLELETKERRNNKRETRRHISIDYLNSKGIDFEDNGNDPVSKMIEQEDEQEFEKLLASLLNPKQIKLLKQVMDGMTEIEIAEIEGVTQSAIAHRLATIKKKLYGVF